MDKNLIIALLAESTSFRNFAAEIVFKALQPDHSLLPREVGMVLEKFKTDGKISAIRYLRGLCYDRAICDYFIKAFPHCVSMTTTVTTTHHDVGTTIGLALAKYIVEDITKDL
jgi:hypothetical protein